MAKPTTVKFSEFLVLVGDGGSPETFSKPCGLTSRGINFQAATQTTSVPDCDNEDETSWDEVDVTSRKADMSGAGILALEYLDSWWSWFKTGQARNVQVRVGIKGHWQGPALLTSFNVSAQQGDKVSVDVTIEFDGEVTWTATP